MTYRDLFFATFGDKPTAGLVWKEIETAHTEPHRGYHVLEHLNDLAAHYSALLRKFPDMPEYIKRIWVATIGMHDGVYQIGVPAGENEAASALLGQAWFTGLMPDEEVAEAAEWTLATAEHKPQPNAPYLNLFLLSDMAILAAPPERYTTYAMQLVKEYTGVNAGDIATNNVPPEKLEAVLAYLKGRRAWLTKQNPEATDAMFREWPLFHHRPYTNMNWELFFYLPILDRAMGLAPPLAEKA